MSPSFQFGKIRSGGGTPDPGIEDTVTVKCRSCEEPIWDGPCNCKKWCKSHVCQASFLGKMDSLIAETLANPVLTMDQWYEQTQQGRREPREPELVPGPYPHCNCTWCREVDRRIQGNWPTRGRRYYGVRDGRGRFVGEVDNGSPTISDTHI